MSHWAAMDVLVLGVTGAVACGGGSNGFEEEIGPLLFEQARLAQEFDGVLDSLFQGFSSTGNMSAAARAFAKRREETNSTHLDLESAPRELAKNPVAQHQSAMYNGGWESSNRTTALVIRP